MLACWGPKVRSRTSKTCLYLGALGIKGTRGLGFRALDCRFRGYVRGLEGLERLGLRVVGCRG